MKKIKKLLVKVLSSIEDVALEIDLINGQIRLLVEELKNYEETNKET